MSTTTVTLEPDNIAAAAQSLTAEFAKAQLSGVRAVVTKWAVHVKMPIDRLADYQFAYDHGHCSWTKANKKIVLELKHFDVEQSAKNNMFLVVLRHTPRLKTSGPKRPNQVREVFFQRSLRAIEELKSLDERKLVEAIQAPTDYSVLVSALSTDEALAGIRVHDPLAAARLRGLAAKRRMIEAEGGALSAADAAKLLEISRQAVDKRRSEGKLLALDLGKKGYRYPSWQFGLKGMDKVLEVLKGRDVWEQLSFFLNPSARLGDRTPLQLLQAGANNISDVVKDAEAYGEQGG
jgi:hypothetical protein